MTLLYESAPGPFVDGREPRLPRVPRLRPFVETVFDCLPRADQRKWAQLYIKALLQTPGKKSVRRLAESVSASPTASQAMHQFVNASPWEWLTVRQHLLRWAQRTSPTTAWTLAPAFIPKRGEHSAGVHRRFNPVLRRVSNCQLGMVMLATGEHGPLPVDWNLYIPEGWATDSPLRSKVRVPDEVCGPLWSQAAELLRRVTRWSPDRHTPLTADLSWLPDRESFLAHLARGEQPFVVEVPDTVHVQRVTSTSANSPALTLRQLLTDRRTADEGERQHVLGLPVTLPGPATERVRLRLLAQGRLNGSARTWLTNLVDRPLPDLLPLMRQPRLAANVVDTLSADFGLQDFEGRSFPGWHRHTTLVSAAFTYAQVRVGHS
ncbi:IS701 family transposase [Streptomyces monashensis]|uniref:Transcriptional regulator n=1 Tax=Streptomyces monashensis TaxID=1678012 RepID=A0A1S2PEV2_9ACTN|nr:transposase [Streptomyces monashensis]OIJ92321.1 transcriptional regulator [Streptomyces monashensis]